MKAKLHKSITVIMSVCLILSMLIGLIAVTTVRPQAARIQSPYTDKDNNPFLDAIRMFGFNVNGWLASDGAWNSSKSASDRLSYRTAKSYSTPPTGLQTRSAGPGEKTADGLVPDVNAMSFICCATYVSYVYMNYLPHVEGINVISPADFAAAGQSGAYNDADGWWVTLRGLAASDPSRCELIWQGSTYTNAVVADAQIGDICVWTRSPGGSDAGHVSIFAGTGSDGVGWTTHVGDGNGADIQHMDVMNKSSGAEYLRAIYRLQIDSEAYLQVYKTSDNAVKYPVTGAEYTVYTDAGAHDKLLVDGKEVVLKVGADNFSQKVAVPLDAGRARTVYLKETKLPDERRDNFAWRLDENIYSAELNASYTESEPLVFYLENEVTELGYLQLQKMSSDPQVSDGNGLYNLKGCEYTAYVDMDCTTAAKDASTGMNAVFTVDTDGLTNIHQLAVGTYYYKETKAPAGFSLDPNVYSVYVSQGPDTDTGMHPIREIARDDPLNDPLGIQLQKKQKN